MPVHFFHADNMAALKTLPDNSIDSVVTDPPYGLGKEPDAMKMLTDWITTGHHDVESKSGFMGMNWDSFVPQPLLWKEVYRVLKPGGHVLAFSGTRTQDLMCLGIRLAGFEIRDLTAWVYGSGMPKSLNVSKAIDKAGGLSPKEQATMLREKREQLGMSRDELADKIGCTPSSIRDWEEGRARSTGSSVEFIIPSDDYRAKLADLLGYSKDERIAIGVVTDRRNDDTIYDIGHSGIIREGGNTDLSKKWEGWGSSLKPALEPITIARKPLEGTIAQNVLTYGTGAINIDGCRVEPTGESKTRDDEPSKDRRYTNEGSTNFAATPGIRGGSPLGRFPANLIHDGSDEVMEAFAAFGEKKSCMSPSSARSPGKILGGSRTQGNLPMDSGTAARFFYCAKANKTDRDGSNHPTVKPIALMRYLVRLVTPPGGTVLDPFAGSGTTGQAAIEEGFNAILIEREKEYAEDIRHRLLMYIDKDETI